MDKGAKVTKGHSPPQSSSPTALRSEGVGAVDVGGAGTTAADPPRSPPSTVANNNTSAPIAQSSNMGADAGPEAGMGIGAGLAGSSRPKANVPVRRSFEQAAMEIPSDRRFFTSAADGGTSNPSKGRPVIRDNGAHGDLIERFAGFRIWKWKHLLTRRLQFVPVLCGLSLVIWLSLASSSIRNESHIALQSIVFSFSQIYIVFCVALLIIPKTQTLLSGSIGLKISVLILLSVFPLLFCLRHVREIWPSTVSDVTASFVTALWLLCVHHLGFPDRMSWVMACALVIMWLAYYITDIESVTQVVVVTVVIACVVIAYGNSLVEAEYKKMYERENIAAEKKLDMNLSDVGLALCKIDDDVMTLREQCDNMVRQKVASTASRGINRNLLRESDSTAQRLRYSLSALLMAVSEDPVSDATIIAKLKRTLFYSTSIGGRHIASGEIVRGAGFGKGKSLAGLCAELFVACEIVMDRGCALFYDQSSTDVTILSENDAVRLMLMLIIEDSLRLGLIDEPGPPGMVNISVQKQGTEMFLVIRRTLKKSSGSYRNVDYDEMINGSLLIRLAQRIAKTHLNTKLEIVDFEQTNYLVFSTINIHLPDDKFEAYKASSASDYPELCPWYIIEYQKSSDDKGNIKSQLNSLSIPHRAIHVYSLPNVKVKSKVAVVHDQWWRTHHHTIVAQILDIASCIIVITSGIDTSTLFKYDENSGSAAIIKVPATITTAELFSAVQMLIARPYPKSGSSLSEAEPVMFQSASISKSGSEDIMTKTLVPASDDNKLEMDDEKELDQSLMEAWKRQLNAFEITFVTTQSVELGARISAQKSIEVMEAHAAINYEALYFTIASNLPPATKKKHKSEVCALSLSQRVSKLLIDDFLMEINKAEECVIGNNLTGAMAILNKIDERAQIYGIEVLRQWVLVVVFCMGEVAENIEEPSSYEVLRTDSQDSNEGPGVGSGIGKLGAGGAMGPDSGAVQINPMYSGLNSSPQQPDMLQLNATPGSLLNSPANSPNIYERSAFSSSSSVLSSISPLGITPKQSSSSSSQSITLPLGGVGVVPVPTVAESPKKRCAIIIFRFYFQIL